MVGFSYLMFGIFCCFSLRIFDNIHDVLNQVFQVCIQRCMYRIMLIVISLHETIVSQKLEEKFNIEWLWIFFGKHSNSIANIMCYRNYRLNNLLACLHLQPGTEIQVKFQ